MLDRNNHNHNSREQLSRGWWGRQRETLPAEDPLTLLLHLVRVSLDGNIIITHYSLASASRKNGAAYSGWIARSISLASMGLRSRTNDEKEAPPSISNTLIRYTVVVVLYPVYTTAVYIGKAEITCTSN